MIKGFDLSYKTSPFISFKQIAMKRNYLIAIVMFASIHLLAQKSPEKNWWKETVFYEIYMPSFQDSNGDGYSDFKGMTSRLDYIHSLGIRGIWLTPFLKSPKVDNGYDVSNYYEIDPVFGTLSDFKTFLNEAHMRGIKVIMDMVLNHTSTECKWFQESRKSKENPYRNYYIWKDKPNNWDSFFGGSAWELDTLTNQYYLHKFAVKMADLNWTNPDVIKEIKEVLRFWLNMGVDGFRFDVVNFLNTDDITTDNPVTGGTNKAVYNINQPSIKEVIKSLKSVVSEYNDRFTIGEVGSDQIDVLKEYQSSDMMDVVFNFNFGSIPRFSVKRLTDELKRMENEMPGYPTLFFGSHDNPRLRTRMADGDLNRAFALTALTLTVRGVPFVYYGEEIGMEDITANSLAEIADIQGRTFYQMAIEAGKSMSEAIKEGNDHSRDKSRSPMQWSDDEYAGFSIVKPWIKIQENYKEINVQRELRSKNSMLNDYKRLIALRNAEPAFQYGELKDITLDNNKISYKRAFGESEITVILNFGQKTKNKLPKDAEIMMGKTTLFPNEFIIYQTKKQ